MWHDLPFNGQHKHNGDAVVVVVIVVARLPVVRMHPTGRILVCYASELMPLWPPGNNKQSRYKM